MLSKSRNIVFWTLDSLKGGKVRKAYQDLKKYYYLDSTSTALKEYQKKSLNQLLQSAVNDTKYYNEIGHVNGIYDFPVVNKDTIREKQESFLSKKFKKEELIEMSTSGSTGTPFVAYQNEGKKRRVNGETIFFNEMAGYKVGYKFVFLRSLNNKNKKTKLKQKMENQKILDVDKMDKYNIERIINEIEKFTNRKSATLLSYASTYDIIRDYLKETQVSSVKKCNIHGIISTSEILYDETRRYMSDAFDCNCYSRYANMENGMLGQDSPEHPNTFIINEANYYIEILKMDSDDSAEFGEVGRVVVTDLYNYAMPMIRYDTGDIGSFTYVNLNGKKKKAITNFGGRKIDMVFDIEGNTISPHKISVTFWNFSELKQFQFIQETKNKYRVLISTREKFNRKNELIESLKAILGRNADICIETVESIPLLKSGKRKYITNNIE